jgi:NAD(P)-dependent dehydrogenase (short-subunit alcohol dehydrogenase family)
MVRTVVITGGSRGIGRATASRFLERGYEVVITGRSRSSLDDALGELGHIGSVRSVAYDSADHEATIAALSGFATDILVCNVGIGYSGTVTSTPIDDWRSVFATNVTSAFSAMSAALPRMLENGWGRIVTVGSIASHQAIRYGAAYTASKHALLGLTRSVAEDTRGKGVTANMVAPAFVRTDMTTANTERIAKASGGTIASAEQRLAKLSSIGRLLEPREVADQIVALAAEDLEVTGASVTMGFES